MDQEQLKILEMVANKTITPEEASKLLEENKSEKKNQEFNNKQESKNEDYNIVEQPFENQEKLDVTLDLGVTNFKLRKGIEEKLFKVNYNQGEGFSHRVNYSRNELQISGDLKKPSRFDILSLKKLVDPSKKKCSVELNPNTKLYMKIQFGGGGKANLDFTGLRVKRLRLSSGASDTKLSFNELNPEELDYLKIESGASNISLNGLGNCNCTEMDVNLGACNANLDFSGAMNKNLYTEIAMRVGRLNLSIPKELGVKIKTSDMLADMTLPNFEQKDGYKVSKDFELAKKVLELRIDSTLAKVNLVWI